MAKALSFDPIGFLESPFETKNGTPRQPQLVGSATSRLKIRHERLPHPEHALDGITGYSHVWIVFYFHKDASAERLGEPIKSKVTPPKSGGIKCGLFSTRTPQRPNAIGLSLVELERVEHDVLYLRGADLIDGTPILDVKPYLPHIDKPLVTSSVDGGDVPARVPPWLSESLSLNESLKVSYTGRAHQMLENLFSQPRPLDSHCKTSEDFEMLVSDILAGDPRSRYRKDKCSDRLYFLEIDGLHVTAWFDEDQGEEIAEVLRIRLKH